MNFSYFQVRAVVLNDDEESLQVLREKEEKKKAKEERKKIAEERKKTKEGKKKPAKRRIVEVGYKEICF